MEEYLPGVLTRHFWGRTIEGTKELVVERSLGHEGQC
jgi:hypothetical protein